MMSCRNGSPVLVIGTGLLIGFMMGLILHYEVLLCREPRLSGFPNNPLRILDGLRRVEVGDDNLRHTTDKNLVLVGVMTAKKFLNSRAVAAYQTWVKSIPGKVIFFSSEGSEEESPPGLPVVGLKNVDDSYPPQKKSFMMFKYMHDHYLDQFRFFMRADDDLYIKGEVLGRLLHSINGSESLFIGQAGLGNKDEFGLLNLKTSENFCMGGTSMILSKKTLARTVPHIGYCLKNMYTTHEDVEIGRCVSKFAGVSCTWAYEMQKIFYNNYREPKGSFTHSLKDRDVHNAATLHPVKNSTYQYRIHQYFLLLNAIKLRNRLSHLQREINAMNDELQDRDAFFSPSRYGLPASLLKTIPRYRDMVLGWDFLSRAGFSVHRQNPRRSLEVDLKTGYEDNVVQVMEMINRNARQKGRTIDFKEILYGYNRVNPLHGSDYILDLLLVYKKFKGKRKMTVPVRRHAYLQQPFLEVEFMEELSYYLPSSSTEFASVKPPEKNLAQAAAKLSKTQNKERIIQNAGSGALNTRINFLLPLSGRYKTFLQFMHNFEDVCLKTKENVSLVVMLFRSDLDDRSEETMSYVRMLQEKYPNYTLRVIQSQGAFSRGVALQLGSTVLSENDLMFFIDVDMYVHQSTLLRIRLGTIEGKSVYYPIVFSQYDPQLICEKSNVSLCSHRTSPYVFDSQNGYWRLFGFGIASLYNSDFKRVGGFDLDIKGWGKEDVGLVDKFISFNMSVFRSIDVGLVHIFHSKDCDPSLDSAQYQMCLGSKAASYASTEKLASFVLKTSEILHRNEQPVKAAPEANAFQENGDS